MRWMREGYVLLRTTTQQSPVYVDTSVYLMSASNICQEVLKRCVQVSMNGVYLLKITCIVILSIFTVGVG